MKQSIKDKIANSIIIASCIAVAWFIVYSFQLYENNKYEARKDYFEEAREDCINRSSCDDAFEDLFDNLYSY